MARTLLSERLTMLYTAAAALIMIAHLQGGKTARDALFLFHFDVTDLPKLMIATALLSVLAMFVFSRMLTKIGPARLIPPLHILSSILSVGEWLAMALWPHVVTVALYLHITVLDALLISGFWSILNERYDPYRAKGIMARMAIFTALGGLLGAGAASVVARTIDTRAVIAMLAILHLLSGLALYAITRDQNIDTATPPSEGLLRVWVKNSLIQRMALLMLVLSLTIALLDYLFKATLQVNLSKQDLVTFFAYFYISIDIGTFLLQTIVGRKALHWFGLGGTFAVLPLSILFGSLMTFVFRSLMSVTLLRAAANLLTNSFFGPGYELLYTPIGTAEKRMSKILIDVGANRAGNMMGGLVIMGLLLLPGPTDRYILLSVMICAGAMGLLILLLNRGYVKQLIANLQDETLQAQPNQDIKRTRGGAERPAASLGPEQLRRKVNASLDPTRSGAVKPGGRPIALDRDRGARNPDADSLEIEAIQALRSGDDRRIRRALVNHAITPALLPHILPLLRRSRVLREALNACRPLAATASGQMVDALLDQHQHPLIRRRIPLLLGHADNALAVQGLTSGLEDSALDVRFRCAEALKRIKTNHPHLSIQTEAVWQVIYREIAFLGSSGFKSIQGVEPLRHMFNLLGLIFGPDVMDICYASLQAQDSKIRGTALEYLENQLPANVRTPLWPLIAADYAATPSDRSAEEILDELLQAGGRLKNRAQIIERHLDDMRNRDG